MRLGVLAGVAFAAVYSSAADTEWRDKFYEGLEANGEVRHEASAIVLRHVSGAKKFGAEKEVSTPLKGVVEWTVSAEVRGSGEAEAGVAMEFFDAKGRSLGVRSGEGVKVAGGWKRREWRLVSPAAAARHFLSVLSLDSGPVEFAKVEAVAVRGKESEALPFEAVPLPFAWNRDWNGGRLRFTSFADSPQPMAFEFKGDRGKMKNPALVLDIPGEIEILDAFNEHSDCWGREKASSEETHRRDGLVYRRLRYTDLRVFRIMRPDGFAWERKVVLVPAPKAGADYRGRTYLLYFSLADDTRSTAETALELRFVDLPTGLRAPKGFQVFNWQSDDRLFSDDAVFLRAAKAWEMAGTSVFNRRGSKFGRNLELIELLGKREVKWRFPMSFPDMWSVQFLGPGSEGFKALGVRMAVRSDGRPSNKLCPEYFNRDPAFAEYYRENVVVAGLKSSGVGHGDWVAFDFEPWDSSYLCVCDTCRAAFAKKMKLGRVPEVKELAAMRDDWAAFRCDQTEASIAKFCRIVRGYDPTLRIMDYDYVQIYGLPGDIGEKQFYRGCAKSSRQNEKWFDAHLCSYYHTVDFQSFRAISNNTVHLEKPYIPVGAIGGYGGYLRAGEVRTPNEIRMLALAAAVHGCPGLSIYSGLHYDGEHFLALMKARHEIASVERFPWGRGKGSFEVASTGGNLCSKTCADRGCEAVALFNYDRKGPVKAALTSGNRRVYEALNVSTGERLGETSREGTLEIEVPADDAVILVFRER